MAKLGYAVLACLLLVGLLYLALYTRTSTPQQAVYWYDSPIIAGHNLSLVIFPCSPNEAGQLLVMFDSFRSSVQGWHFALPLAPACP